MYSFRIDLRGLTSFSATPNTGTATNRGGTVQISGFTVIIPDNLLVEFPAAFIPFAEFTAGTRPGQNEVSVRMRLT